jgi:uncharacterized protein YciW
MDNHSTIGRASSVVDHGGLAAALAVTRLGVVARLADPYLTEHDPGPESANRPRSSKRSASPCIHRAVGPECVSTAWSAGP